MVFAVVVGDVVCQAVVFAGALVVVVVVPVVLFWLPPRMFVVLLCAGYFCMRDSLCKLDSVVDCSFCMLVRRLSSVLFDAVLSCIFCSVVVVDTDVFDVNMSSIECTVRSLSLIHI